MSTKEERQQEKQRERDALLARLNAGADEFGREVAARTEPPKPKPIRRPQATKNPPPPLTPAPSASNPPAPPPPIPPAQTSIPPKRENNAFPRPANPRRAAVPRPASANAPQPIAAVAPPAAPAPAAAPAAAPATEMMEGVEAAPAAPEQMEGVEITSTTQQQHVHLDFDPMDTAPVPEAKPKSREQSYEQLKQLLDESREQNTWYHNQCASKDATIADLNNQLNTAKKAVSDEKRNQLDLDRTNQELTRNANELRQRQDNYQQSVDNFNAQLSALQTDNRALRDRIAQFEVEINERDRVHDSTRKIADDREADLHSAQYEITRLGGIVTQYEQQAGSNNLAHQYMGAINAQLEQTFTDQGKELTPESFAAHLQRVSDQSQLNRQSSELSLDSINVHAGPATGQRKRSVAEEIAQAEADESDVEDAGDFDRTLRIGKQRTDSSHGRPDPAAYEALQKLLGKKVFELGKKDERINELQKLQKNLRERRWHGEPKHNDESIDELEALQKKLREKDDQLKQNKERINELEALQKKLREKDDQLKQNEQRFKDYEAKLSTAASEADKLRRAAKNAKATTSAGPTSHTRYVGVHRKVTVWEALFNGPLWQLLLVVFLLLSCITMWVWGLQEQEMWLSANRAPALNEVRYRNSPYAEWGLRIWFEDLIGYDSTMLG